MSKPITDILRNIQNGSLVDEASDAMRDLLIRVDESGKTGKLTLEISVSKLSRGGAVALRGKVKNWSADSLAWLKTNYPDGVPEAELETIAATLNKPARPGLRVVGGE